MPILSFVALSLLASFLLASCDSVSHARLSVLRTVPANKATDVPTDAPVVIVFSFAVRPESVNAESSFIVEGSTSGRHAGVFAFSEDARRLTFTADEPFAPDETVRVALTSDITSTAGTRLARRVVRFQTRAGGGGGGTGGDPVSVESTHPAAWAQNVAREEDVVVVFSDFLNPFSVTPETVRVAGSVSGPVPVQLSAILEDGRTVRIRPRRPYAPGEVVSVNLTRGIAAASGGPFHGHTFSFRAIAAPPPFGSRSPQTLAAAGAVAGLAAADLDGDGLAEVVYSVAGGSRVEILRVSSTGVVEPALTVSTGLEVLSLAVGDLDGDGDLDLVLGAADRARAYELELAESTSSGFVFSAGAQVLTSGRVHGIALGDLDLSGTTDLVLDTDSGLQVLLDGLGAAPSQTIGSTRQARTPLTLADLDADGRQDLVYGSTDGRIVAHFAAPDAPGRLGARTTVASGGDTEDLTVEDLNGDGFPDILALPAASPLDASFRFDILLQDSSDGSFPELSLNPEASEGSRAASLALGDLRGDGIADAVVSALNAGSVLAFDGQRRPALFDYAGRQELIAATGPTAVALADFNGDGSLDIAAGAAGEVRFLLSAGAPPPPPPPPASFRFEVDDVEAQQGAVEVSTAVRLSNPLPIDALSVVLGFDASVVASPRAVLDGLVTAGADFTSSSVREDGPAFLFSAVMELLPLAGGGPIPAGSRQEVLRFVFDVASDALPGDSALAFIDAPGQPPVENHVVVAGVTRLPELASGRLHVLPRDPDPSENPNQLRVDDAAVSAGSSFRVAVLAAHDVAIEAFTVAAAFDPEVLESVVLDLEGSRSVSLAPELVIPTVRAESGYFACSVLFDLVPPFEDKRIPPGEDDVLFFVEASVRADAPLGLTTIEPRDGLGIPPLSNIFSFGGQSYYPELHSGVVQVVAGGPEGVEFLRGDANSDHLVNVADVTFLLDWLSQALMAPSCLDALDVNDDGAITRDDATFLLAFLFAGSGIGPQPPFPEPGLDPTTDALECR